MASIMGLHFSVQEKYTLEHTNVKCHLCTLLVNLYSNVQHRHRFHNTIEHTYAKMLASALERHVLWGDTNAEVVDTQCKVPYISK